ncbi:125 kDa kinesin-related protein-like [Populus alba x Populus x berolinensis]|uniref:125 kDa kinesin-related protein-like n=1 Tax=Populus alba x Populus x berolinensis TaxID=444605 RepID=A0AAD6LLI8_9ROSI|nr:125 kDa kinesin-related protein-like [Populus alba x Populus x berolinensis]
MDFSQSQQQKRCNTVLLSPAQTPRSSVRRSCEVFVIDGPVEVRISSLIEGVNVEVISALQVFGPTSRQKELFDEAISPIVNEVLEGYNCTIFAYGQTGTGKTYTMEGGRVGEVESGEFPSDVGIIPRAVQQILDVLEARSEEYCMKVTFLELYNEDIMDLLCTR